ncbi:MAG TPA: 2-amino-4-hydroxy-6-hydroxymethyldihydropteridine diphosphokinase [Mycobacteriales bacterium]|nr:2-amino-4-hydroxy-6-hydroxymethyldihydropteridine diphosphokinase [Mycobacteriales bacterium]
MSLGSNLGDRVSQLRRGLEVLSMHLPIIAVSGLYETAAVGVTDQPDFLNLVATLATADAEAAFVAAQAAETAQGRLRSRRWGPRSLDVDVIDVDGQVSDDPRLTLPHPRARERAFVLVPWLEIDPVAELPRIGRVSKVLERIGSSGVRRVAEAPR